MEIHLNGRKKSGMHAFMEKPFPPEKLTETLRKALGE
jgi:FixJ family two-component response regulator